MNLFSFYSQTMLIEQQEEVISENMASKQDEFDVSTHTPGSYAGGGVRWVQTNSPAAPRASIEVTLPWA